MKSATTTGRAASFIGNSRTTKVSIGMKPGAARGCTRRPAFRGQLRRAASRVACCMTLPSIDRRTEARARSVSRYGSLGEVFDRAPARSVFAEGILNRIVLPRLSFSRSTARGGRDRLPRHQPFDGVRGVGIEDYVVLGQPLAFFR